MATTFWKFCGANLGPKMCPPACCAVRNGHHMRGKPPGVARSLEQRMQEADYKDPKLHFRVDIGLPRRKTSVGKAEMAAWKVSRTSAELEKRARTRTLQIDLDEVERTWDGPEHVRRLCDHYGVFGDLYGDAYFVPSIPLNVRYDGDVPVHFGNIVKPSEAAKKPTVHFECDDKDSLWTLLLTNPDGHFTEPDKEYVHWFVGNIPGGDVEKGETIVNYLRPFPPKGTGYHRMVFVLYKQEKRMDYSRLRKDGPCFTLDERTFSTLDFYRSRQDDLTPAGLAFYQSDWDAGLREFYHDILDMKEPIFEYDFPEPYVKRQEWFPLREAFNLYMDRYRDPKQVNKEFLVRRLKDVHPFKPPVEPLPYPNAVHFEGYVPTWLKLEIRKSRLKWGRVNDID